MDLPSVNHSSRICSTNSAKTLINRFSINKIGIKLSANKDLWSVFVICLFKIIQCYWKWLKQLNKGKVQYDICKDDVYIWKWIGEGLLSRYLVFFIHDHFLKHACSLFAGIKLLCNLLTLITPKFYRKVILGLTNTVRIYFCLSIKKLPLCNWCACPRVEYRNHVWGKFH